MLSLALLASLALAAPEGRLAVPPWPLSPDGDPVAAPRGVSLTATGGAVEPLAPGLWLVVPQRGATEVTLRAGEEAAAVAVEPPPGRIELRWSPPVPVKGSDRVAVIELAVVDATARPGDEDALPRLTASVGRLGPVERLGPGRFRAAYELPPDRLPEVAALFAVLPRCPTCATPAAEGVARLPLAAAIELPGETDPGAMIHVEIGGEIFGPVKADRAGRFRVPVIIPPGATRGVASSVNALGNERSKPIDLPLPPTPRLACAAFPSRLPADGRARAALTCLAHAASGEPAPGARVTLAVDRGAILGAREAAGVLRAELVAPRGGAGPVEVAATWREAGGAGRTAVRLEFLPGAPARLDWQVAAEPLRPGEAAAASAQVRDARGDLLGPARAEGARAAELAAGRFVARPELGDGLDPVTLAFALPVAEAGEVARLSLRRDALTWVAEARAPDGRPVQGVPISFQGGAAAVTDGRGEARVAATGDATWVTGPGGLRAAGWAWAPPQPEPVSLRRPVVVALRPAGAVDVDAAFDGRFVAWTVRTTGGGSEPARDVLLRASGVELGPPEATAQGGRAAVKGGRGSVAVIDAATGSAALVEVP